MKRCPRCKEEKPAEAFPKSKLRRDGLSVWCRACFKEYNASRYRTRKDVVSVNPPTKLCLLCGREKALSAFYRNAANLDGHGSYCRTCRDRKVLAHERAKPPKSAQGVQRRLWRLGMRRCAVCQEVKSTSAYYRVRSGGSRLQSVCKSCSSKRHSRYVVEKRQVLRGARLTKEYGITLEEFETMLALQENCCAICGKRFGRGRQANVDHCHRSHQLRGIICNQCNTGLGLFKDDLRLLRQAQHYLSQYAASLTALPIDRRPTYTLLAPKTGRVRTCLDCGARLPESRIRNRRRLCSRCSYLFGRFRIRSTQYYALLAAQQHRCAICERQTKLVLDHAHRADILRGFLCDACNLGLGAFGDSAETIERAWDYIEIRTSTESADL